MPLYVATATHVAASRADQPTAARVLAAFRQVFSPSKGWVMLGGGPRITREIHADSRPRSAAERGLGVLTVGAGLLLAPITLGMSLSTTALSAATSAAVAGAVRSFVTTSATAVIETSETGPALLRKLGQEFARVLGAGWSAVAVTAFAPAVNGPEADWRSGAIQRASLSTDPQGLAALALAARENPVGPTPPNPPRGGGVVTALVDDVTAAGAAGVANVTRGLAAGVANVTGAAGDGLRNLGAGAAGAASSVLGTLAWVLGGAVVVGVGASYLIGKSTGKGTAATAGGALSGALALTPVGRVLGNPTTVLDRAAGASRGVHVYHGRDAVKLAREAGMKLPIAQYIALDKVARAGGPVVIRQGDGEFVIEVGPGRADRAIPPRVRRALTSAGMTHLPEDAGWGELGYAKVTGTARGNPASAGGGELSDVGMGRLADVFGAWRGVRARLGGRPGGWRSLDLFYVPADRRALSELRGLERRGLLYVSRTPSGGEVAVRFTDKGLREVAAGVAGTPLEASIPARFRAARGNPGRPGGVGALVGLR